MRYGLTTKQRRLYDFIRLHHREKNIAPTCQEMADHHGLKSKGSISVYINKLEQRGYVARIKTEGGARGPTRNITIIENGNNEMISLRSIKTAAIKFVGRQKAWRADPANADHAPGVKNAFDELENLLK